MDDVCRSPANVVRISICERFDFIEPLRQACLFEVTPDLLLVNAGDLKQELDVRHLLQRPCRIALHRVHLHRGDVLEAGREHLPTANCAA